MGNSFYFWTNVAFSHFSIAELRKWKNYFTTDNKKEFKLTKKNCAELEN